MTPTTTDIQAERLKALEAIRDNSEHVRETVDKSRDAWNKAKWWNLALRLLLHLALPAAVLWAIGLDPVLAFRYALAPMACSVVALAIASAGVGFLWWGLAKNLEVLERVAGEE